MLTLKDLFGLLGRGELSNLSMVDEDTGEIRKNAELKIRDYTNEALLRLHSRFILSEKTVLIEMVEAVTNYHLLSRFAQNYEPPEGYYDEPIRYIMDLPKEPFEDSVIQVLTVFDSFGTRLPLNDDHAVWSVFTPQPKIIQVTRPIPGQAIAVHYKAMHPKLTGDADQIIDLPDTLLGALTSYIAYKAYSHTGSEGSNAKAQEHYTMFTNLCAEVDQMDLVSNTTSITNVKFDRGGWI